VFGYIARRLYRVRFEFTLRHRSEIGFSGQCTAQPTDGVLDAAFLPRGIAVAEVGLDTEVLGEPVVVCELGAVVEGDGSPQGFWQLLKLLVQCAANVSARSAQ